MYSSLLNNQPNNLLINHLGLGVLWYSLRGLSKSTRFLEPFSITHFSNFFRILLYSGTFYATHPFTNKLFYKRISRRSLPKLTKDKSFQKFYRVLRLKSDISGGGKKSFLIKKTLKFLNVSEFRVYRKANELIMLLLIYLPVPFKRNYVAGKTFKERTAKPNNFYKFSTYSFIKYKLAVSY